MTLHKNVSGGKPNSEDFSGAGRIGPRNCGTRVSKTDISAPSDFKHVAHVGFNAHDGWDSCFLSDYASNSDLQLIFTKAGIREEHLRDRRTSIKIFEIIERGGGMQAVRKQASRMGSRGPSPRPVREPFASKVPHQPIVPLLPPLKLLSSMSSSALPAAPPLPPSFTNRAALNLGLVPPAPPLSPPFTNSAALNLGPIPPAPPLPPSFTVFCAEDDVAVPAAPPVSLSSNECAVADQALVPPAPPLLPFLNKSAPITPVPTLEPEPTFICAENDWSFVLPVPPVVTNTTSLLSDPASVTPAPASCYPLESRPAIPPAPSLPSTFNSTTSAAGTLDLPPSCNLSTSPSILPACSPSITDPSDTLPTEPSTDALAPSLMRRSRSSRTILVKPSRNKMLLSTQSTGKKLPSMEPTSLMDQIRKGVQLKSAKDTPVSTPIPVAENEDLVKALMEVIRKRDRAIRIPSDPLSEEEWDD